MVTIHLRSMKPRLRVLCGIMIMMILTWRPAAVAAADAGTAEFQGMLQAVLEALWTGQDLTPELKQKQETIKDTLRTGAVQAADLEAMLQKMMPSVLDRQQTSRYIQIGLPEQINALLAPQMDWKKFKDIAWKVMASPAKKEDPMVIKLGTLAPPGTPWLSIPETVTLPEIERLSEGKLQIKIYGGGVMGEDTDILRKIDIGQLDSCGCTAIGVLAASPDTSALLLPGLFKNYAEIDYICEKFRRRLDEGFEKKGYILAALIDTGYFYIFSANKITGLEDLRKQKVLTWFGAMETTLYKELGINATPVAVPEVVSALSTGLADTNMAPAAWMLGMQAYQYSNYYLKPPFLYCPAAVIVSSKTKERLQKQIGVSETYAQNIQEMLVAEFNVLEPEWKKQIRAYEEKSLKAFESKCGMKAMTFSPEDMKMIEKASQAVLASQSGKTFSAELMADIQKELDAYRASKK
ncbi:MAG: TRAP transporter substrate-binding protein DctP [Thermodesulfobacteriota bacterium]